MRRLDHQHANSKVSNLKVSSTTRVDSARARRELVKNQSSVLVTKKNTGAASDVDVHSAKLRKGSINLSNQNETRAMETSHAAILYP